MGTRCPIAEGVEQFLAHLTVERGLSANTVAAYRRDLDRYAQYLAGRDIDDLDQVSQVEVAGFSEALRSGELGTPLAPTSTARHVVAVRQLHQFLVTEGRCRIDPAAKVRPATAGQHLPKALGHDQVDQLLGAPDLETPEGLRDRALLELLYGTGARVSEVIDLDVDDLTRVLDDPDAGLRLVGKGNKERMVPLGSYARQAVQAWLVRGRPDLAAKGSSPALLLNTLGRRLSRQSAFNIVQQCGRRAGLTQEVSPHTLRHTYATHLLEGGADVRVVQELLGHASVVTTQIYTMVTVDQLRQVHAEAHPRG